MVFCRLLSDVTLARPAIPHSRCRPCLVALTRTRVAAAPAPAVHATSQASYGLRRRE